MPRTPRSISDDTIYHILNRANGRDAIFHRDQDYDMFEKIISEGKEKYPVSIFSFCIMPNHWHFVLSAENGENISKFMRWITHTHTQKWHVSNKSIGSGHVYQGRYKSFPIEKDEHFLQACRYVERNPVRAGLAQRAEDWKWSSLWKREYGTEKQKSLLSAWPVKIPESYRDWINILDKNETEKLNRIRHAIKRGCPLCPLGSESWVKDISSRLGLTSTLNPIGRPKKCT